MTVNKLKILCLHGFRQDASMFYKRTSVIRETVSNLADFVYIDAPHIIKRPIKNDLVQITREHTPRGWWYAPKENAPFMGYTDSMAFIQNTLSEQGPFDGILGFSQGAAMTAILTELLEKNKVSHHDPLRFSILVSGFRPNLPETPTWILSHKDTVKTPTLHYIGDTDTWVDPSKSLFLTNMFENSQVFHHTGGHYLPSTSASQDVIKQFLLSNKNHI